MQPIETNVLDYWPAILILAGLSHIDIAIEAYTAFGRVVAIIALLFWLSLGVLFFLNHPPLIWLWRLLPIAIGLSGFSNLAKEGDGGFLVLGFVWAAMISVGVSALFFVYEPTEVWHWVRGQEVWDWVREQGVVKWLFEGPWYIVLGKITGFIGVIGTVIKYLMWIYSHAED